METTDLARAVHFAIDQVPGLGDASVDLRVASPERPCAVRGREQDLTDVLKVLLENALKFSPAGKTIRVVVSAEADDVMVAVSDQGEGFPPELASELFHPFTITDSMHHQSGTALNLARVAAIVGAHGGSIRAASEGPGRGSTFTVSLPAAA